MFFLNQSQLIAAEPVKVIPSGTYSRTNAQTSVLVPPQITSCSTCSDIQNKSSNTSNLTTAVNQLAIDAEIDRYSKSPQVSRMIRYARRNKLPNSINKCYRYVKYALQNSGNRNNGEEPLVDTYLDGLRAKDAGADLVEQGFVNILNYPHIKSKILSPANAPKGAILVYEGGKSGHIEIKGEDSRGQTVYISDYMSYSARTRDSLVISTPYRKLIGVYIKRGL